MRVLIPYKNHLTPLRARNGVATRFGFLCFLVCYVFLMLAALDPRIDHGAETISTVHFLPASGMHLRRHGGWPEKGRPLGSLWVNLYI